jgi:hypothetical protein
MFCRLLIGLIICSNFIFATEESSWGSSSSSLGITLSAPKLYYISVENSDISLDVDFAIDNSGDQPVIELDSFVQEIATISAISNDKTGYNIKIVKTKNNFILQNKDTMPASIPYSIEVDNGKNYTGSTDITKNNSSIISVGPSSNNKKLFVKDAKIKIRIPPISGLAIDNTVFSDTLTISIVSD